MAMDPPARRVTGVENARQPTDAHESIMEMAAVDVIRIWAWLFGYWLIDTEEDPTSSFIAIVMLLGNSVLQ